MASDYMFTDKEINNIAKAVALGGVGAAGAAAIAGAIKASNKKKQRMDFENGDTAITVPIKKRVFMKGLPDPAEFKKQFEDKNAKTPVESGETAGSLAQEDIDAAKKSILRSAGKNFDYFRKAAEINIDVNEKGSSSPVSDSGDKSDDDRVKLDMRKSRDGEGVKAPKSESYKDQPRDEAGRFMSPDDSEKAAGAVREAIMYPAAITAAGFGAALLASRISDEIAKIRVAKAKKELDAARDEYVTMLGDEKRAEDDGVGIAGSTGRILGTAVIVPAVLSALIANRVMDKRLKEKDRKKENNSANPKDPIILYKTSEGKDVPVTAEDALFSIFVKKAMIEGVQALEASEDGFADDRDDMDKEAGIIDSAKNFLKDKAVDLATSDSMDNALFKAVSGAIYGDNKAMGGLARSIGGTSGMKAIMKDPRFQDSIMKRFSDPGKADTWGKLRDDVVGAYIQNKIGDGWLGRFSTWLANKTGIGGLIFNNYARKYMSGE